MMTAKRFADARISCHRHTPGRCAWLVLLPLVAAGMLLAGCHESDDVAEANVPAAVEGKAAVRIKVSVGETGDLNSTRAPSEATIRTDTYEGNDLMNTLCIFVTNTDGEIELKLHPTLLTDDNKAAEGTVLEYTSDVVYLPVGTKIIYAFSNWEGMDCDDWDKLIAKNVGDKIQGTDLEFAVESDGDNEDPPKDPASLVDPAKGVYIPMSGLAVVRLGETDLNYTQTLDVGLNRLVDKVAVYINGVDDQDVTLQSLTVSGFADKVALFSDYYDYSSENDDGIKYTESKTITINNGNKTVAKETSDQFLGWVYVNETFRSEATGSETVDEEEYNISDYGYSITLQTADIADGETGSDGMYDDVTYFSTTETKDIPRNCIFPVSLSLESYELKIKKVDAYLAGNDTEPYVPYYNVSPERYTDGSNVITLGDITSKFELTLKLIDTSTSEEVEDVSWDWDYSSNPYGSYSSDGTVLTATQTTAAAGYQYTFKVVASWETTSNEITIWHSRTYNIVVEFDDILYTLSK